MQNKTDNKSGGVTTPFPDYGLIPTIRIKSRADYLAYYFPRFLVAIFDLDLGGASVTNDIENVLNDVNASFHLGAFVIVPFTVIYRDSMGIWDEVVITSTGKFQKFASIDKKTLYEAVQSVCGNSYDKYIEAFKDLGRHYGE